MATGMDGGIRWLGINACPRCGGLLVAEPALDFAMERLDGQTPTVGDAPAKRCVQCGEVIDAVILRNRRHGMSDAPTSSEPVKHGSRLTPTKERS